MAGIPFAVRIRNKLNRQFAQGNLTINSDIIRVPHIGEWLSGEIAVSLGKTADQPVTLQEVLNFISVQLPGASTNVVAAKISLLCQNRNPSVCLGRNAEYFARDINKGCAIALPIALQIVLPHIVDENRIRDGLLQAINRVHPRGTTAMPDGTRFSPAAQCECLNEAACRAKSPNSCNWIPKRRITAKTPSTQGGHLSQCVPNAELGFEGLPPYSGQIRRATAAIGRLKRKTATNREGFEPAANRDGFDLAIRGEYGQTVGLPRRRWRRTNSPPRVAAAEQDRRMQLR